LEFFTELIIGGVLSRVSLGSSPDSSSGSLSVTVSGEAFLLKCESEDDSYLSKLGV